MAGLSISLILKGILNSSVSIFNQRSDPKIDSLLEKTIYTIITFLHAWTELGYIFVWMLLKKPYEFYSKMNIEKCKLYYSHFNSGDGQLSRYLTEEGSLCKCCRPKKDSNIRYSRERSEKYTDLRLTNDPYMNSSNNFKQENNELEDSTANLLQTLRSPMFNNRF